MFCAHDRPWGGCSSWPEIKKEKEKIKIKTCAFQKPLIASMQTPPTKQRPTFSPSCPHCSLVYLCWSTCCEVAAQSTLYCVLFVCRWIDSWLQPVHSELKWPRNNNRHPTYNTRWTQHERGVNGWVYDVLSNVFVLQRIFTLQPVCNLHTTGPHAPFEWQLRRSTSTCFYRCTISAIEVRCDCFKCVPVSRFVFYLFYLFYLFFIFFIFLFCFCEVYKFTGSVFSSKFDWAMSVVIWSGCIDLWAGSERGFGACNWISTLFRNTLRAEKYNFFFTVTYHLPRFSHRFFTWISLGMRARRVQVGSQWIY